MPEPGYWSERSTASSPIEGSVINEVPEQYWWLDPEVDPHTLIPMHALLAVLIEVFERDYTLDTWTYRQEAVPILTEALNMGLRLRGRPLHEWGHCLYPFLDMYFYSKDVQIEIRSKWSDIVCR